MTLQCTICMSSLNANELSNAGSCRHVFHEPCLVEWFLRSKTCPQCRARCEERNVRRLYFSAALNTSSADVDALQVELDEKKLELRNLSTELRLTINEVNKLRIAHNKAPLTVVGMESESKLLKVQMQNANSQIASLKNEVERLRLVEKELQEKINQCNNLENIKRIIESDDAARDVGEILKSQPDVKSLATLVTACKKDLDEKIDILESDNYKMKDDLSQMQKNNESKNCTHKETALLPIQSTHTSRLSAPTTPTTRTDSPYLNIRQSNVGLTSLLNRKRKPETDTTAGPYRNLTIFNNRQKIAKSTGNQNSSLIYNGFGGSERKENFIGFPKGEKKTNPAGRGLSMLSSHK